MAESPYRSGYGVEDRVREPNDDERALIAERHARDLAVWKKVELTGPRNALNIAGVALISVAVAVVIGRNDVAIGAGVVALLFGVLGWLGYQKGLERIRRRRSRWNAPDAEWRTHETRIRARSVVFAASEDEDYTTWLLFEIPGGEWAAVDDLWVPPKHHDELPNDDLVLTWLEPANECIGVETHGGPLPRHGALRLGEPGYEGHHFAQAIADGFGWGDPDDEEALEAGQSFGTSPIRRIPEDQLPEWMRDAVLAD